MGLKLNRFKKNHPYVWPFTASLEFEAGLYGFEHEKRFLLIGKEEEIPVLRLSSVRDKMITFCVIDPFAINPAYDPSPAFEELLSFETHGELFLLALINFKEKTVNLQAPLLIDWRAKKGRQILLPSEESNYPFT